MLVTLCLQYRNLQSASYAVLSFIQCCYALNVKPFDGRLRNWTEATNEITVMLVSYHLLCFTDFVSDYEL